MADGIGIGGAADNAVHRDAGRLRLHPEEDAFALHGALCLHRAKLGGEAGEQDQTVGTGLNPQHPVVGQTQRHCDRAGEEQHASAPCEAGDHLPAVHHRVGGRQGLYTEESFAVLQQAIQQAAGQLAQAEMSSEADPAVQSS